MKVTLDDFSESFAWLTESVRAHRNSAGAEPGRGPGLAGPGLEES